MKKWVVFLLILLALIGIFLIDLKISNNIKSDDNNSNTDDDKTTGEVVKDNPAEIDGISGNAVGVGGSGGSGGGGGASGGGFGEGSGVSENNPETTPSIKLPSDLNTRPCGFYFVEYAVCAGVCPDGQCLIDGKSCYCRIV